MYFKFKGQKYEYKPQVEDTDTGVCFQIGEEYCHVVTWAPTQPHPKPLIMKECTGPMPDHRMPEATRVSYSLGSSDFTVIQHPKALTKVLRLFKKRPFKLKLNFERDVLAHTDSAIREELISLIVTDDWGKFKILDYQVVGFEKPNVLHISGHIGFNTRIR